MCMALGLPLQMSNVIAHASLIQERTTERTELNAVCEELAVDFNQLIAFTGFKYKSINQWRETNPRILTGILKGYAYSQTLPPDQFAALLKPDFSEMLQSFGFVNYNELNRFYNKRERCGHFHMMHKRIPVAFAVMLLGALEIRKGVN